MSQSTKTALAAVMVIFLAGAFWLLLLGPKRDQASELSERVTTLRSEVASENSRAIEAAAAKRDFPQEYKQLVLLGKAVPGDAATPSLLVQLNGIGRRSEASFEGIELSGGSGEVPAAATTSASPTESAAALLPLGASVGPAGLSAMPYSLSFEGRFFNIADFIEGLDSLVQTEDGRVEANGRLVTIDGFSMTPNEESPPPDDLVANFNVTTYVTPPGQGLTAGATATGPAPETTASLP